MKSNPVFSIKRFEALIGNGMFKNKIPGATFMLVLACFAFLIPVISQLINGMEIEHAKMVMTKIYQVSYIIYLSIPALRNVISKEKQQIWFMLPASYFEKTIYFILKYIIWYSILFFIAVYAIDYMVWNTASVSHTEDYSICCFNLKDMFTLDQIPSSIPQWAKYPLTAIYFACFSLTTVIASAISAFRPNSHFFMAYLFFVLLGSIIDPTFYRHHNIAFYMFSGLGSFSLISILISSFVRSYKTSR